MYCRLPGFSVHGISQARILEWAAISFSKGSSQPLHFLQVINSAFPARNQPCISCIGRQILYHWATREVSRIALRCLGKPIALTKWSISARTATSRRRSTVHRSGHSKVDIVHKAKLSSDYILQEGLKELPFIRTINNVLVRQAPTSLRSPLIWDCHYTTGLADSNSGSSQHTRG